MAPYPRCLPRGARCSEDARPCSRHDNTSPQEFRPTTARPSRPPAANLDAVLCNAPLTIPAPEVQVGMRARIGHSQQMPTSTSCPRLDCRLLRVVRAPAEAKMSQETLRRARASAQSRNEMEKRQCRSVHVWQVPAEIAAQRHKHQVVVQHPYEMRKRCFGFMSIPSLSIPVSLPCALFARPWQDHAYEMQGASAADAGTNPKATRHYSAQERRCADPTSSCTQL